jgi:ABC-type amino acid transport substrate-binding protein
MMFSFKPVLDLVAVIVLLLFGWTISYTNRGAADPVWTAVQERGALRVGVDPGFRPFAIERDGRLTGYDIDLATELARRLNLRVEFVPVAYDALYDALSTRQVDLLAAALPLAPEQGWRARFSTPYLNAGQVLVLRRDGPIDPAQPQLAGHTIGVALGSDADTWARVVSQRDPSIELRSEFETPVAALDALDRGDLDAVITDAVTALSAMPAYARLTIATDALTFDPYVLAVPAEAYLLHSEVNRVLDAMRAEGMFGRLNDRWFRPDVLATIREETRRDANM